MGVFTHFSVYLFMYLRQLCTSHCFRFDLIYLMWHEIILAGLQDLHTILHTFLKNKKGQTKLMV